MDRLTALAESFGASLRPDDREKFESTTFNEMQIAIGEIQAAQVRHRVMMNMNRLRMFLSGMEEFRDTLAALNLREADQALNYVWGSLRFLLEKTHKTDRAFDKVLDVYERLGADLPRVLRYKDLFIEYPDSQECLANIYEDIQKFHSLAYKLFTLRPKLWQRLCKPVWKDLSTTFKQLGDSLSTHSAFLKSSKTANREVYSSPNEDGGDLGLTRYCCKLRESWERFADEEEARRRKQRRKVNAWISSSGKNEEMQKKFQGMRACADSGRWLFRRYSWVTEWMRAEDAPEPAIWLHGSKGFGKTMLASLVVDELKTLAKRDRNRLIPAESKTYHFFCQEDDEEHSTHLNILKGILSQMVAADPYILPLCEDKMINGGGGDTLVHPEMAQSLIEVFVEHNPRQYVVVDGLDECDITEARQTAEFFKGLVRKYNREVSGQVAGGAGDTVQGRLRVLYTSQPMPDLSSRMPKDDASIALKAMDNVDDIRMYVRSRIPEFSEAGDTQSGFNLSDEDKEQMVGIICEKSEGMFLHAHLTVEYLLQQQTKGDILDKINQDMPEGLSEIYEKLLGSMKERLSGPSEGSKARWDTAKLLLGWLVCAKRALKWYEMQAILAFDPDSGTVDFDNRMLRHNVRKYLGSLVHVLDGGHIKLIHSTARWYIVRNRHIHEEEVQYKLAALCLKYLSLPCFADDRNEAQRKEDARHGWFSFQDYACSQWHSHVDTVIRGCNDISHTNPALEEFSDALEEFSDALEEFSDALECFIRAYGPDLAPDFHPEFDPDHLLKFTPYPFHANLLTLWNHIYIHQKSPVETRNTIGISTLTTALHANRTALETHFIPSDPSVHHDTIQDYYGPNLFKCRRTLCYFFHAGHPTRRAREEHDNRHDRPHPCPLSCQAAPIGFSTAKDKDRHVRIYHPELGDGLSGFKALTKRQAAGKFECRRCPATFTRKVNLQGHERSHYGDRPYACSACGKAFARVNDCRRHERGHVRRRREG